MKADPRRGEVWWVDWTPGRGSEQTGRRPAVVLQSDQANLNPRYPNTIVAAASTRGRSVSTHVLLEPSPENGLASQTFIKGEQLLTISKDRLLSRIGRLSSDDLDRVNEAVLLALGF